MFEREIALFQFMQGYLKSVVADLDASRLGQEPAPGVNPPAWTLAHMAISNDFVLAILGSSERACPQSWSDAFGPRMSPSQLTMPYPTKEELQSALERGADLVCRVARDADPAEMDKPHSVALFRQTPIKTVGDAVALLMTTHFATHLGQLSLLRRQSGYAPVF
jgi:hypothetical protein